MHLTTILSHSIHSYCSKDCQIESWSCHKRECPILGKYNKFTRERSKTMGVQNVVRFWSNARAKTPESFDRNTLARICNTLLHLAFVCRREMGHQRMLKAHVLNAAFLRQSCATSIPDIAKRERRSSNVQQFLDEVPYYKAGVDAVLGEMSSIDNYLEENGAENRCIIGETMVEGEALFTFFRSSTDGGGEIESHHIELDSDLTTIMEGISQKLKVPSNALRFTFGGVPLSINGAITPSQLGMKSRCSSDIEVSLLSAEEHAAQRRISEFVSTCCRVKKAKIIVARGIIADFVWRCLEQEKLASRRMIADLVWRVIASQRRLKLRGGATTVQRHFRGHRARNIHLANLQQRLKEMRHFCSVWQCSLDQVPSSVETFSGWALAREKLDLKRVEVLDEDGLLSDVDGKLDRALEDTLHASSGAEDIGVEEACAAELDNLSLEENKAPTDLAGRDIDWSQFLVTSHVIKFLRNGDPKYREIFVKRMKQLGAGDRSYKLQKPLKGFESIICEECLFCASCNHFHRSLALISLCLSAPHIDEVYLEQKVR